MGEEEGKKRRVVESLGWLTESSILPKKHRAIEGVGASSILELKAQLYKSQEEAKQSSTSSDVNCHRAKKKITPYNPLTAKNSGVESHDLKDKLELKAIKDGSNSYAALEKKAELYDKLVRGELYDEEDKEKYCVDFFRKSIEKIMEEERERRKLLKNSEEEREEEREWDEDNGRRERKGKMAQNRGKEKARGQIMGGNERK
ncbi:uncharacterized protein At4g18257-like [Euphorbia lathyris]|uniref:uncharacterized protein At4g18257-like n=1 Tax=Euphorbia lathyris TaxID=212925 RepID=UPI0033142A8C